MALGSPFEVGLRHRVCSPARSRLGLPWLLGAFPRWCVSGVLLRVVRDLEVSGTLGWYWTQHRRFCLLSFSVSSVLSRSILDHQCADFRRLLLGVRAALQAYALEGTVTLSSFSSLCLRVREALLSPLTHPFLCAQVCFFPALDGCVVSPEEFFRFSVVLSFSMTMSPPIRSRIEMSGAPFAAPAAFLRTLVCFFLARDGLVGSPVDVPSHSWMD